MDMTMVMKAETQPPLNKIPKLKRQDWSNKYCMRDFSKVSWTDKERVTLDGPDRWSVAGSLMYTGHHFNSGTNKVEEEYQYGQLLLRIR